MPPPSVWSLDQMPGLSAADRQRLRSNGIHTTQQLLVRSQTPAQMRLLAAQLQMSERWVRKWAALAELSQLPSVGYQYCGLLLHGGVTSIPQLATLSAQTLHRRLLRLQVTTTARRDLCPSPGTLNRWIKEAQQYPRPSGAQS